MGQFLTLKNMITKFFQNSNFSDFLGIKSEISHLAPTQLNWVLSRVRSVVPSCSEVLITLICSKYSVTINYKSHQLTFYAKMLKMGSSIF